MTKNSMIPRIRFKGFTDAWEQRKLGSIVYRASEMSETDDLPRVEYEDIDAGQGSLNKDLKEKVSTKKGIMFQSGDVLYGKLRPYLKNWLFAWFSGVAVGDFWVLRSNQVSQSFIYRLVQTPAFEYIANQSTGSKMPRADWNLVSNTTFAFPTSNEEQEAIGQIFLKLDNLITLHQRKYEKFVNIKKALLEKMFPQGDEKVPRIRFKGFTDAWEQRKLGEVARSFEYGLNAAAKEYDGLNKYLRITDIDDVSRKFDTDNLTSPDTDLVTAENYRLVDGDILFARTGASVGKSYIYRASDGLVYFAGFLIRAKIKPEYDAEFVFQNTLSESYQTYILITSQRSGQPGVNAQEYSDYTFYLPTYDEQQKIGAFLCNLDNLITLHQRQVEKLKNIKSALLEKMFV